MVELTDDGYLLEADLMIMRMKEKEFERYIEKEEKKLAEMEILYLTSITPSEAELKEYEKQVKELVEFTENLKRVSQNVDRILLKYRASRWLPMKQWLAAMALVFLGPLLVICWLGLFVLSDKAQPLDENGQISEQEY